MAEGGKKNLWTFGHMVCLSVCGGRGVCLCLNDDCLCSRASLHARVSTSLTSPELEAVYVFVCVK